MNIKELILKAVLKQGSKAAVARYLGVSPQHLQQYLRGVAAPPWVAGKLADLLGEDVEAAEIQAHVESARSEAERAWWKRRMTGVASFFFVALVAAALINPQPSQVRPSGTYHIGQFIHYAYLMMYRLIVRLLSARGRTACAIRCAPLPAFPEMG